MADDDEQPQYTTYRSRPRAPWRKDDGGIDDLREPGKDLPPQPGAPKPPKRRRRFTVGRVVG